MDPDTSVGGGRPVIASAAHCFPGEVVSGDAWTVQWGGTSCRLTVLDGLGHGPEAAQATGAALDALAAHPDLQPADAVLACHQAMAGTRGAAMLTLQIDPSGHRLMYAGIGNVEGRLCLPERDHRLVSFRGIVGTTVGNVRSFTLDLPDVWMLIVHTDGISARFRTPTLDSGDWQALADQILAEWGRATDDATVVVVGPPTR